MNLLELISDKDLLEFSQNYPIQRSFMGDALFPDRKTEHLEAEYMRLADEPNLPYAAEVHGFDTEARIGTRKHLTRVTVEKLLIKEKINLSEKARLLLNHGVKDTALINTLWDDMGNMAEAVKTRTEAMKMEALQTGKVTIAENGVKIQMDYGVPAGNKVTANWKEPTADILGDIQKWVDIGAENGHALTKGVTSTKILRLMQKNEAIQKAIHGSTGVGVFTSAAQLNALLSDMFGGLTLTVDDQRYVTYEDSQKTGKKKTSRFFAENAMSLFEPGNSGALGAGLWGVTPEEEEAGPYTEKSAKQFITLTRWATPDPVAVWTKASGVFIPVIPNPNGLVTATITIA